jgi:hypothetical protein
MSTLSIPLSEANRFSINWIVNKKSDLLFFIGGALTGYLMFFLHSGLHLDMLTVWFLWVVFIDTPHFFGTYVRTYFDKEEFKARKPLLLGSLAWLFVGPVFVIIAYLLYQLNIKVYSAPFYLYVLFFNLWAYWHVVRQHYGIMSLYKKKNQDFDIPDTRIDKYLLYGGLLAPFAAFIIRHPEARMVLGLQGAFPAYPNVTPGLFSPEFLSQLHWEHAVVFLSVLYIAAISVLFIYRQIQRWRLGMPLNIPKILFFIALIPLYAYINYSSAVLTAPLIAFSAFVTVYHDIQYHAIVWFYYKNRYHKPGIDKKKYGMAVKISRNFATYMLSGIAMAAFLRFLGCGFEIHPGCGALVMTSDTILFGTLSTKELLYSIIIGIPIHHYFVDQYIWRPSKDKVLQEDLKLEKR